MPLLNPGLPCPPAPATPAIPPVAIAIPTPAPAVPVPVAVKTVSALLFVAPSCVKSVLPGILIVYCSPIIKEPATTIPAVAVPTPSPAVPVPDAVKTVLALLFVAPSAVKSVLPGTLIAYWSSIINAPAVMVAPPAASRG